jgi:hypothetical protein
MDPQLIFLLQVALSTLLYALIGAWYAMPRLVALPLAAALQPLLLLHATRHLGMVFLVPNVVGEELPRAFAVPAAYGDLLAGLLALLSLVALRRGWGAALAIVWVLNVEGLVDLAYAMATGARLRVQLGAAYYIPTMIVPALVVTHVMMLALLLRARRSRPA